MTDFAKSNVNILTVIGALVFAATGAWGTCAYLSGFSTQIASVSAKVDIINNNVTNLANGQADLKTGQTAIWSAIRSNSDVLQQHSVNIQELKDAVNKDAAANRAQDSK